MARFLTADTNKDDAVDPDEYIASIQADIDANPEEYEDVERLAREEEEDEEYKKNFRMPYVAEDGSFDYSKSSITEEEWKEQERKANERRERRAREAEEREAAKKAKLEKKE